VLNDDMACVAITPQALEYLAVMDSPSHLPLPICVYAAAATLRAIEDGTAAPGLASPTARVHTRTGKWLTLHASRLSDMSGQQGITVVIEEADARSTLALRLSAAGLSPREAEVATLVVRGSSTNEISAALHISVHTVQDHLKVVFDKVGVRSRRELIGTMLTRS